MCIRDRKDGAGAPNSFGGKSGDLLTGVAGFSPVRPALSFDITDTSSAFTGKVGSSFKGATTWTPQLGSQSAIGKQNKASMSFAETNTTFTQNQSNIQGTTTTTSLTSGTFLN